jgi:hypothetical protein
MPLASLREPIDNPDRVCDSPPKILFHGVGFLIIGGGAPQPHAKYCRGVGTMPVCLPV